MTIYVTSELEDSVKQHEGLRLRSYQDSEGIWTIGYGRNLQDMYISHDIAELWLRQDLDTAAREAMSMEEYQYLDTQCRRDVFIEMCYNLGRTRLRGFRKMLAAIALRDFKAAATEMLDSKWAVQVGRRAETLAERMRNGYYDRVDSTS